MSESIKELPILSSAGDVFFGEDNYIIPLYQRAFAWEETQITQLISDIGGTEDGSRYYLGNLIVHKRLDDKFEVIDGQQRLTALFLLLSKLGFLIPNNALTYQHRDKSIKALAAVQAQKAGVSKCVDWEDTDERIRQVFQKEIKIADADMTRFIDKLKRVLIIRIEVPEHTDLNKYFEIMNSRGEQLELPDILKAKLMSMLGSDKERIAFSRIWVACSNMNGYMQMHFKKQEREHYFDKDWSAIPKMNMKLFSSTDEKTDETISSASIDDIITGKFVGKSIIAMEESDDTLRFESFLTFNYFLLHSLRVFMGTADDGGLLDDRKLIKAFCTAIAEKKAAGIIEKDFALGFIKCLMRCRFLFDNYIIKREKLKDDSETSAESDGREWSLKRLVTYWGNDKRYGKSYLKPNYINTADSYKLEMLQSMLRVTYTSPKVMHWVTKHLAFLYSKKSIDISEAELDLEAFAQNEVHKNYLKLGNFELGLDTHHIVFNYLDYLLWIKQEKPTSFKFEFRNSVEHWYPQNPLDGNPRWDIAPLNNIGNLCLVSSSLNSKFSNNLPTAKKNNFGTSLGKQSLKLRSMADETNENDDWTADKAKVHGEEMIELLKRNQQYVKLDA